MSFNEMTLLLVNCRGSARDLICYFEQCHINIELHVRKGNLRRQLVKFLKNTCLILYLAQYLQGRLQYIVYPKEYDHDIMIWKRFPHY